MTSGCAFYLDKTLLLDTSGSVYSNMICKTGGVFFFEGASLNISGATFLNIESTESGGILYLGRS